MGEPPAAWRRTNRPGLPIEARSWSAAADVDRGANIQERSGSASGQPRRSLQ
jgi:hypothetical protein